MNVRKESSFILQLGLHSSVYRTLLALLRSVTLKINVVFYQPKYGNTK